MPTVQPRVYIDPPEVEPYQHGLFGVARELTDAILTKYDDSGRAHWQYGGVEWDSLASYLAAFYAMGVGLTGGAGGTKAFGAPLATASMQPFAVYAGIICGSQGRAAPEYNERALRALEYAAQRAVEAALWSGSGGQTPSLNITGTTDLTPTPGTSVDVVRGLGLLENYLGSNYGGRGVIHARRAVSALAANHHLVKSERAPLADRDVLVTPAGSRWLFGAGYDGTGPAAAAPAAGNTWLYASGEVLIANGDAQAPASIEGELNRQTNQVYALAEQPYIVGWDGPHAGVLVDLTK
jgi:hypothetical protein